MPISAFTGVTSGYALGYVQANLVIVPTHAADAFEAYCRANPQPCPLLERLPPGDPRPRHMARDADIRTDLPAYLVCKARGPGEGLSNNRSSFPRKRESARRDPRFRGDDSHCSTTLEPRRDILDVFTDDDTAFLLGCSFGFEAALTAAGMPPRHVTQGVNVPMYQTQRQTVAVPPFDAPLVVSMRPIAASRVAEASEITRRFPLAHGAPVHHGRPELLGITDISSPSWGDPVNFLAGEVPVFWACGVTSQLAVLHALETGAIARAITHAPGHMFLCDEKSGAESP